MPVSTPHAELRRQFAEFDLNGDGSLDASEFRELIRSLGVSTSPELVAVAFDAIDLNGDGRIDFGEFSSWWQSQEQDRVERLRPKRS